jgi:hypothetical protein
MVLGKGISMCEKCHFLLQSASFDGVFGVFLPENGGLCLPIGKQAVFVTR